MAPGLTHGTKLPGLIQTKRIINIVVVLILLQVRLPPSPRRLLHASQLLADVRKGGDAVVVHAPQYLVPHLVWQTSSSSLLLLQLIISILRGSIRCFGVVSLLPLVRGGARAYAGSRSLILEQLAFKS